MRAMKDSGIYDGVEIPESWDTMKFGKVCSVVTDFVASGSFADLRENVPYLSEPDYAMLVRTTDLAKTARSEGKVYISKASYDFLSNSNLFGGEIVLPNIGSIGDVYVVPKLYDRMSLAPNSIMFKTNYCDKYYYYYFLSKVGGLQLSEISQATAMAKFNKTDLKQIRVFLPSIAEQQRIAEFLDRKCAEVDEMIALQEQIIEELKAYKQSVITEAVTKGLNPAAPMRDSGIEWIGSIPEHWSTKRLKDVGYLYGGLTGKAGDDFIAEDDETCQYMRFIPYTNIFNNYLINPAQLYKVRIEEGEKQNLVNKGDILFLMSSEDYDGVGKPAMIDVQVDNLGLNSFCKGFRITDNGTYPKYLLYLLLSHTLREMVRQEGKGFIRINLRQDKLSTCPIILPDIVEQQAIADYLDEKCADIDSLIQTKQSKIDSLKEYKKSIIYEYVTGKREVE